MSGLTPPRALARRTALLALPALFLVSAAAGVAGLLDKDIATAPTAVSDPAAAMDPYGALSGSDQPGPVAPAAGEHRLSQADLDLLARVISAEARGQPFEGQVAVGAVVLNRVESPRFPNTVREVVYAPGQFEVVANGHVNLSPIESAVRAAERAAAGEDPTGGALCFFNPARTGNAFLWSRPLKVIIGDHRFTG
ncbi:MAG: cell wall hydrolase [Bacillota bacterium]